MATPLRHAPLVLSVLLLLALPAAALAAWPHDPLVNLPVCTADDGQVSPVGVSDGAGGVILAWQDFRAGNYDIYAQRISSEGVPLWGEDGVVVCDAASAQMVPAIATDRAGGAVIAWRDLRGANQDIYVQKLSAVGVPQWTANGLAVCTATGNQDYPQVAPDSAGGVFVAWVDSRAVPVTGNDIYVQRVSTTGIARFAANGIALCTATGDQQNIVMAGDPFGGVFVAWDDLRTGGYDVYAQRVASNGWLWPTVNGVAVCTATQNQIRPRLVYDDFGGAIVGWQDARAGNYDVYAQRLDGTGALSWTADGLPVASGTGTQGDVRMAADGRGGAVVAWTDERSGTADIYAQRVDAAGAMLWTANGVALCTASGVQTAGDVVTDASGAAIVSWSDLRNGVHRDAYARAVDATGAVQWQSNGVAVCTAPADQWSPGLVADGAGGAILFWGDTRRDLGDIWCQRVDRFGALGDPAPAITRVSDVPFDQGGRVQIEWTASYLDTFPVYDVARYTVWRRVPEALSSGLGTAASGPGRIVLAGVRGTQAVYWQHVGTQLARGLPGYSYVAETTSDSLADANPYTAFMVMAEAAAGIPYWMSAADSGYSVDDLAPAVPAPFSGTYAAGTAYLQWGASAAPDFAEFRLYRGHGPDFVPDESALVAVTTSGGYVDPAGAPFYYKLCAVDVHGNASPFATLLPAGAVDVPDPAIPRELALSAPAPNPLRGSTTLRLALPRAAEVRLAVFDQQGRRVRGLLAGGRPAGEHAVTWDGRDDGGRPAPSGVYFVRLEAEGRVFARRLAVVR